MSAARLDAKWSGFGKCSSFPMAINYYRCRFSIIQGYDRESKIIIIPDESFQLLECALRGRKRKAKTDENPRCAEKGGGGS